MSITYHPRPGTILMCDFSPSFKEPEMVKKRPVVVISKDIKTRDGLVTVVPLSTQRPKRQLDYHYLIPKKSLPMLGTFQSAENWVKGDMIYTVGFHRLDQVIIGKNDKAKRVYFTQRLGGQQMDSIYKCVLHGLGFGKLGQYLNQV